MSVKFFKKTSFNAADVMEEFKEAFEELRREINDNVFAYCGCNLGITIGVMEARGFTVTEIIRCLYLFFERGNNIERMHTQNNAIIRELIRSKRIKSKAEGPRDLTLARIAAAALPLWPKFTTRPETKFNLLNLTLSENPAYWLAVPGIASGIPKDPQYDILMVGIELFSYAVQRKLNPSNKSINPMDVPLLARNGNYLSQDTRIKVLSDLGILFYDDKKHELYIVKEVIKFIKSGFIRQFTDDVLHAICNVNNLKYFTNDDIHSIGAGLSVTPVAKGERNISVLASCDADKSKLITQQTETSSTSSAVSPIPQSK